MNETIKRNDRIQVFFVCILTTFLLIVLDQVTKNLAVMRLKGQSTYPLIKGVLEFYYLENTGAAFSLLENAQWFFIIAAIACIVVILVLLFKMPTGRRFFLFRLCLVGILSGAIGNLIDRILFSYVRDFIYFSLINFPVFNVADIYVTCATFLLAVLVLFYYKEDDFTWIRGNNAEQGSGTEHGR